MAKAARSVDRDTLTEAQAKQAHSSIMGHYEAIEASKGRHMNTARQERDRITAVHEKLTQFGISQKASKLTIKIARMLERVKGWQADLEEEDRKQAVKLAKLIGDKQQLSLFDIAEERRPRRPGRPRRTAPTPETPVEHEPEVADAA